MMNATRTSRITLFRTAALAVALVAGLAACNKPDDERTAGQKLDDSIADAKQAGDTAKADAAQAADQAQAKLDDAAKATAAAVGDAAIVTRVNAALVADDKLKVLKIAVSSSDGRVKLTGTAPDADSRQRATALVATVDGVRSVDNQLVVTRNG